MKNKVLAYIYRFNKGTKEVLVFDHKDAPEVNPQVPAGTIDEGESPETAVLREVLEESGLDFKKFDNYLGHFNFQRNDINQIHKRYVFEFYSQIKEEKWEHRVSSNDGDDGMLFDFYWLPVSVAKKKLVIGLGDYFPDDETNFVE